MRTAGGSSVGRPPKIESVENFLVARYLYERHSDGRYIPKISVQLPGQTESLTITDPEERTYRDLNLALEMDFWLLNGRRAKHALRLQLVITPT